MKTSKKEMVSALEDRYMVVKINKGYSLYDKDRKGKYTNIPFVAHIQIKNGVYMFNGNKYTDVNELSTAIDAHVETLPFSSEIYDPMRRKNSYVELACHEYLKSLGFESSTLEVGTYTITDTLTGKELLPITIDVDEDKTSGKIIRGLSSFKWMESKFEDLDSAIASINSLISTEALMSASRSIQLLDKMNTMRSSDITMNSFNISQLKTETKDMREWLIEMMENELKGLKEHSK